ncbi:MAG: H-NS histone family protein [Loktanella sp.]|nr:H-NS histone family protein [Loktanella sp.]
MNDAELERLEQQRRELDKQIEHAKGKAQAKDKLSKMARDMGYDIEELFGGLSTSNRNTNNKSGKTRERLKAMYQNPDNLKQTWAGPVRPKPQWVQDWEAAGKDIEETRIQGR